MATITVDAELFRLAHMFVSKEETRYYLNGVFIESGPDGGAIAVATDGHRMFVTFDEKGSATAPAIVKLPRFAVAQCKAPAMFSARRVVIIDTEANSATIRQITPGRKKPDPETVEDILTAHKVVIDGTYPDWRRVVPAEEMVKTNTSFSNFNPTYLKDWGTVGAELAKMRGMASAISIQSANGDDPCLIRWAGFPNVVGVQMPMRGDVPAGIPAFIRSPDFKQAAE